MKKSVDILGLPIISIADGCEIGVVKKLILDRIKGSVSAVIIDDGQWYHEANVLPFEDLIGISNEVITIGNTNKVLKLAYAPDMKQLLDDDVAVIGAKAVTNKGRFLGTITEIFIDDSGKITKCEVEDSNGSKDDIPAVKVLTFGREVVMIADGDSAVG